MKNFDMHCHTTISDGTSQPMELIEEAKRRDLEYLFITDHDYPSDTLVPLIRSAGIKTFPSLEISATNQYDDKSLHLTYYSKETGAEIESKIRHTRISKERLILEQLNRLIELGFFIDIDEFYGKISATGRQRAGLSKYDIARYIAAKKENIPLLSMIGCMDGFRAHNQFYAKCLKRKGELYGAYGIEIDDYEPEVEVLGQIAKSREAILSIAHPNFSFSRETIHGFLEKFPAYKEFGINAIEINTRATKKWVEAILSLKELYGDKLQLTFGSDCHQVGKPDEKHGDLGFKNEFVPTGIVEREMERLVEKMGIE